MFIKNYGDMKIGNFQRCLISWLIPPILQLLIIQENARRASGFARLWATDIHAKNVYEKTGAKKMHKENRKNTPKKPG